MNEASNRSDVQEDDLTKFLDAQQSSFATALAELTAGQKRSHWMWFVFPQLLGLGHSAMAQRYAIRSVAEAQAYLAHPVLGARLKECAERLLNVDGRSAVEIFGTPDDLKLRSSMTLFNAMSEPDSVFQQVLERYFDGVPDGKTLDTLAEWAEPEPNEL